MLLGGVEQVKKAWHSQGEPPPGLVLLLELKPGAGLRSRYVQDDGYPASQKFGDSNSWRVYTAKAPLPLTLAPAEGAPGSILCTPAVDLQEGAEYGAAQCGLP